MSKVEDQKFIHTFAAVIAVLVAIAIVILALTIGMGDRFADTERRPYSEQKVIERIQPVGTVSVAGATTGSQPDTGSAGAVAVADDGDGNGEPQGEQVFNQACAACHRTGVAGAPVYNDSDEWAARLEQGRDVLIEHSINGFTGESGFMPPRGGQAGLSDAEVTAALDYMLEQSGN